MPLDHRTQFRSFIAEQLNRDQQKAVIPEKGMFLVRAGAGSGKTRVITARIVQLILEHGVPASSIIALTFTNRAAGEMKERVQKALPAGYDLPIIGTFHSFCLQLLKRNSHLLARPVFSIMDGDDREQLLRTLIKKHSTTKRLTPSQLGSVISRHKNDISSMKQTLPPIPGDPLYQQLAMIYEQEKRASHCFDFDDLLIEVLRLFQTNSAFKAQFQHTIQHILVDEYQDTNKIQHALIREMVFAAEGASTVQSLCVVGDEDQSIYSWRGATIDNILQFTSQFPEVTQVTIAQNYRSVDQILQAANQVISNNTQRVPKDIWSKRSGADRVRIMTCGSSYQEGDIVAACGAYFHRRNQLSKLAILYRSHFQSRSLEEALIRHSIPYKIIGGTQFYDRQEIKDILAYLRLIANPFDRISFMRAINTPSRGLGDAFVELFLETWELHPLFSVDQIGHYLIDHKLLTSRQLPPLERFLTIYKEAASQKTALEAAEAIIGMTHFLAHLTDSYDPVEAQERIANVRELFTAITALAERGITGLREFLDEVALLQDFSQRDKEMQDYVSLMTLHSAKGLEFDTVILPGLEEGIFPNNHARFTPEALEEERRLLYVGITRACERLLITRTLVRAVYGQTNEQTASRFLEELPERLAPRVICLNWPSSIITQYIGAWLAGTHPATPSYIQQTERSQSEPSRPSPSTKKSRSSYAPPIEENLTKRSAPAGQAPRPSLIPRSKTLPPSLKLRRTDEGASYPPPIHYPPPQRYGVTSGETGGGQAWKLQQKVSHPQFGVGTIINVDTRTGAQTILTVQFPTAIKKIAASFVTKC